MAAISKRPITASTTPSRLAQIAPPRNRIRNLGPPPTTDEDENDHDDHDDDDEEEVEEEEEDEDEDQGEEEDEGEEEEDDMEEDEDEEDEDERASPPPPRRAPPPLAPPRRAPPSRSPPPRATPPRMVPTSRAKPMGYGRPTSPSPSQSPHDSGVDHSDTDLKSTSPAKSRSPPRSTASATDAVQEAKVLLPAEYQTNALSPDLDQKSDKASPQTPSTDSKHELNERLKSPAPAKSRSPPRSRSRGSPDILKSPNSRSVSIPAQDRGETPPPNAESTPKQSPEGQNTEQNTEQHAHPASEPPTTSTPDPVPKPITTPTKQQKTPAPPVQQAILRETTTMLRHSALAACAPYPEDTHFVYFQDDFGGIREATFKNGVYDGAGRNNVLALANNAKWHTPLAAVALETSCGCKRRGDKCGKQHKIGIYLFYLNSENFIRSITFNGEKWSTALQFNKQLFRAHPNSKLSAIALEGNSAPSIRLYYQNLKNEVFELVFTTPQGLGTAAQGLGEAKAEELIPRNIPGSQWAMKGTGIAASCYPGTRNLFLFYQDVNGNLRQLVNEGLKEWKMGTLTVNNLVPQCAFTTVCHSGPGGKGKEKEGQLETFCLYVMSGNKNLDQYQWKKTDPQSFPSIRLSALDLGAIDYGNLVTVSWLDFPEEGTDDNAGGEVNDKEKPMQQIRVFYQDECHELTYLQIRGKGNKEGAEAKEIVTVSFIGGGGQANEKAR